MRAPRQPELEPARRWSAVLATTLAEITDHVDAARRRLADAWPDARGREWTDRLHVVQRALERHADAAVDLGRAIDHVADGAGPAPLTDGPQLGGTGARRVDDRRGVTIPWLSDPADDDG